MQETRVRSLGWEDPLEKEMATHSGILAWETHGQRSLARYKPWSRKEADRTEHKTGTWLTPQNRDTRDLHKGPGDPGTQSKAESLYGRRGQASPTYQGLTMVPGRTQVRILMM